MMYVRLSRSEFKNIFRGCMVNLSYLSHESKDASKVSTKTEGFFQAEVGRGGRRNTTTKSTPIHCHLYFDKARVDR